MRTSVFQFYWIRNPDYILHRKVPIIIKNININLTLVLLDLDIPCLWTWIYPAFANSVDPDQLASEEANWSGSALFAIKYVNLYEQSGSSNLIG